MLIKPIDSCEAPPFEAQARLFWLLSDKTRLHIIHLLSAAPGQLCVEELVTKLGNVAQPTVSHHLKLLYYGGLLSRQCKGLYKYYRIQPHTLDKIRHIVGQLGQ